MFMDYHFLFEIAVILLSTKVLGIPHQAVLPCLR